jgi:hypothetical protein
MTEMTGSASGNYLLNRIPPAANSKTFFGGFVLSAGDEATLLAAARVDTRKYVYNAVVSFLGGISGLHTQQSAWAITKMYYTAFYIGRAALCRSGRVIFHVPKQGGSGHTQYEIQIVAGAQATVVDKIPSTHKLVARRFQQIGYPAFMRGLTIDGADPFMWLMDQREYWQYRSGRFPDPYSPNILDQIDVDKAQRYLAEYAADTTGLYLSDPAHAVVAVPFRLVIWALALEPLLLAGVVDAEDISYLRKRCLVGKQVLGAIGQYFPEVKGAL